MHSPICSYQHCGTTFFFNVVPVSPTPEPLEWTTSQAEEVIVEVSLGRMIKNGTLTPDNFHRILSEISPGATVFYTDASRSNFQEYMGIAWVCPRLELSETGYESSAFTINEGEAMAIIRALAFIKGSTIQEAVICSDSLNTLDALKKGFIGRGVTPFTCQILEEARKLRENGQSVQFWWSPAHIGIEGNELCDELAGHARTTANS